MDIFLRNDKKFEVSMKQQLLEVIKAFGEKIERSVASPAKSGLFTVNSNSESLSEEKMDIFHSVIAIMLYLSRRVRPDLDAVIYFLTQCVSCSDVEDWGILRRMLTFVYNIIDDVRVIAADYFHRLFVWIDTANAVHLNVHNHTGGAIFIS